MNNGEYVEWEHQGWQFGAWEIPALNPTPESKTVVAFHGFNREAKEMGNFMPLYDSSTSMLSISLLHHGSSKPLPPLSLEEPLSPQVLIDALEAYVGPDRHQTNTMGNNFSKPGGPIRVLSKEVVTDINGEEFITLRLEDDACTLGHQTAIPLPVPGPLARTK